MPRHVYGPTDYENPDAPEGERRLRADHLDVRDLSYDVGRVRQRFDLYKGAIIQTNIDGLTGFAASRSTHHSSTCGSQMRQPPSSLRITTPTTRLAECSRPTRAISASSSTALAGPSVRR
jgi:hypothetical protein